LRSRAANSLSRGKPDAIAWYGSSPFFLFHARGQFAQGISMAHACTTELQPAINDVVPSIAQTILSKVRCAYAVLQRRVSASACR
jgi:hypothetical protein